MSSWKVPMMMLAFLLGLSLLSFAAEKKTVSTGEAMTDKASVADSLPPFKTIDIKGKGFNTASLRGKPAIILISPGGTMPEREQMNKVENLYKKYKDRGLNLVHIIYMTSSQAESQRSGGPGGGTGEGPGGRMGNPPGGNMGPPPEGESGRPEGGRPGMGNGRQVPENKDYTIIFDKGQAIVGSFKPEGKYLTLIVDPNGGIIYRSDEVFNFDKNFEENLVKIIEKGGEKRRAE